MVADAEIVRNRESRIRQYVSDLREMAAISEAAFLQNRERQYAVLRTAIGHRGVGRNCDPHLRR